MLDGVCDRSAFCATADAMVGQQCAPLQELFIHHLVAVIA
jgi:hypothetical protein